MKNRVAGMVLAAGQSRRLGMVKQLILDENGEALVARSSRQLLEAGCAPVFVVVGAYREDVSAALSALDVTICENEEWDEGMGSSIRRGIRQLLECSFVDSIGAVVIATCDMPGVSTAHIQEIIATGAPAATDLRKDGKNWNRVGSAYVGTNSVHQAHGRVRGVPTLLPKADWPTLLTLSGDRGAKSLIELPDTLSVFLRLDYFDIDTPSDLAQWRANHFASLITPTHMSTLAQTVLADLDHEIENTRKVLARVPADNLQFSPHEKSWPLQRLANHVTDFGDWGVMVVTTNVLDFAEPSPPRPPAPETAEAFVAQYDTRMAAFKTELAKVTDAQLQETWTLRMGEQVLMAAPRISMLRDMVMNHMIHHRAQLTIYLRLLNIPIPGMYGPSADES